MAGLPVRSHWRPSASHRMILPSTRSGPLGRTMIFTGSDMKRVLLEVVFFRIAAADAGAGWRAFTSRELSGGYLCGAAVTAVAGDAEDAGSGAASLPPADASSH